MSLKDRTGCDAGATSLEAALDPPGRTGFITWTLMLILGQTAWTPGAGSESQQ
jgi:hypothetical protein